MFGRVRASPAASLEFLESQRSSCKIIKNDSLSIYESTLLKLKQGSRCNASCNTEESASADAFYIMDIDSSEAMAATSGYSSTDSLPTSSSSAQSTASSNEEATKNMSILHFFSKHKSAATHDSRSEKEPMAVESDYSSCSVSPASSG